MSQTCTPLNQSLIIFQEKKLHICCIPLIKFQIPQTASLHNFAHFIVFFCSVILPNFSIHHASLISIEFLFFFPMINFVFCATLSVVYLSICILVSILILRLIYEVTFHFLLPEFRYHSFLIFVFVQSFFLI